MAAPLILLLLFVQFGAVHSSATVKFWFRRWSNPDSSELDGGCCDPGWTCGNCDNYFIVCLDDNVPGSNDFNECGITSITTDTVYSNNDEFDFPTTIPNNIPNPKAINVFSWQGQMRIKLRVWDSDGNADDLIDEDFLNIQMSSAVSASSATWQEYTIGTHAEFIFRGQVYCNNDYYTSDCSVFCAPTDNQNGHYTCDPTTGGKICHDGWEGIDCNEDKNECQSGPCLNEATCINGRNLFSCVCTEGWTGNRCDMDVDQCETNPCFNDGTCNDFLGFFNCSCPSGHVYADDLCEYDDCANQPCLNGSTCNDLIGNFSCSCAVGFEGRFCDVDIDECANYPCQNGGNCTDNLGWFNCTCPPGFEGELCQTDVDECRSNPCSNQSTCEDLINRFYCHCPVGFEGKSCSDEINECEPDPCRNNATCLDLIGYFECSCSTGFFGEFCEVDIDYCLNQTCANNGTCVDRLDGFHCLCEKGYEGVLCGVETDECASGPCMHNSTCHDLIGQYWCSCVDGYEGTDCELETDECASFPCKNGSTCIDRHLGFYCHCVDGFEGNLCDIDTDECQSSPCYDNETCIDVINGFRCVDGIDMCENHLCENNSTCFDDDRGAGYTCECLPGYEGRFCQHDKDECQSSPCFYGTCEDHLNGFSCHCLPGYEGNQCENDTNDCANAPCEHGRCVDLVDGFACVCTVECTNGPCVDGMCRCTVGFEGEDCSIETNYCNSSPCGEGTCVPLFNSYRCECDPFHEGEYCKHIIGDPCSLSPCKNGQCSKAPNETAGFICKCNEDFYGRVCDIALKDYGCIVFIVGIFTDTQTFEKNMAVLLKLLMTSATSRQKRSDADITVDVVKMEDYVKSKSGEPLTRVTFVAQSATTSTFLPKSEVEPVLNEAPQETVKDELGLELFHGKAEPKPTYNQVWVATHWYAFILIILAIACIIATGIGIGIRIRHKRRVLQITRPNEALEMDVDPDDGHYNVLSDMGDSTGNQTSAECSTQPGDGPCNTGDSMRCLKDREFEETAIENDYYNGPILKKAYEEYEDVAP